MRYRITAIETLESRILLSAAYSLKDVAAFPRTLTSGSAALGNPIGNPVIDGSGNLFGVAEAGGTNGNGGIFELPKGGSTIVNVASFSSDLHGNQVHGIVIDSQGNIWGAAQDAQYGILFELPAGSKTLVEIPLQSTPYGDVDGPLAIDAAGDLFDTSGRLIWELPAGNTSASSIRTVATFPTGQDGDTIGGLVIDGSGNIFGLTQPIDDIGSTPPFTPGIVFEVPAGSGTIQTLATIDQDLQLVAPPTLNSATGTLYFQDTSGMFPAIYSLPTSGGAIQSVVTLNATGLTGGVSGPMLLDSSGNLIGEATGYGPEGSIFELPAGSTTVTDIADGNDKTIGGNPSGSLGANAQGDLFGYFDLIQTSSVDSPYGEIFELAPGGSTGGGGSSPLSPAVARSGLAASIIAGSSQHGSAVVDVTNNGSTRYDGPVTTQIYASSDGAVDSNSILIASVKKTLIIAAGRTATVTVPIESTPAQLNGSYQLLAQTIDSSGNTSAASSGPSLTAAAPFLAFSDSILSTTLGAQDVSGQRSRATVRLEVTNQGNIAATGSSTIALYVSPDATPADGTLIRSLRQPLALRPGADRILTIPLQSLPAVADGSYFLVVQITDPQGNLTSAAATAQYTLAAPFISLIPQSLAFNNAGAVTFSVTNNGNVPSTGSSTVTLLVSATARQSDAQSITTQKLAIVLPPAARRTFTVHVSKTQLASIKAATSFYLQLTDPNGVSQVVEFQ